MIKILQNNKECYPYSLTVGKIFWVGYKRTGYKAQIWEFNLLKLGTLVHKKKKKRPQRK